MRPLMFCFAALFSLPLLAQQQTGDAPSAANSPASELTAERYRDLIVNTADPMRKKTYGQFTAGTGT
jgi:hypothetical protein